MGAQASTEEEAGQEEPSPAGGASGSAGAHAGSAAGSPSPDSASAAAAAGAAGSAAGPGDARAAAAALSLPLEALEGSSRGGGASSSRLHSSRTDVGRTGADNADGAGDEVVVRKGSRPRPKTASKKAVLPSWEVVDASADIGERDGEFPLALTRLVSQEESQRLREEEKQAKVAELLETNADELAPLRSYEEEVLQMVQEEPAAPDAEPPRNNWDVHPDTEALVFSPTARDVLVGARLRTHTGTATAALAGAAEEHRQLHEVAAETQKDPTFRIIPTGTGSPWYCPGGRFAADGEHATLHGESLDSAVALCQDADASLTYFDCQADIMIESGDIAGLVFRGTGVEHYKYLRLDASSQRIELREVAAVKRDNRRSRRASLKGESDGVLNHYRFTPIKVRNNHNLDERHVSFGRLELRSHGGHPMSFASAKATNPGGVAELAHGPDKCIDDSNKTKYSATIVSDADEHPVYDFPRAAVVIKFPEPPAEAESFRFVTAYNCKARDPVQWVMHGSRDGTEWFTLHSQTSDYDTPVHREAPTAWFPFQTERVEAPLKQGVWHRLRVRATKTLVTVWLDEELCGAFAGDVSCRCGSLGVYASRSKVLVRNFSSIDLQSLVDSTEAAQHNLMVEGRRRESQRTAYKALKMQSLKAVSLVQDVMRIKLRFIKQRMRACAQAHTAGQDGDLRARRMLVWLSLLKVMSTLGKKLRTPEIRDAMELNYLRSLPPPPPPPPAEDPPTKEDEALHYQYEEMRALYEPQWSRAGKRALGPDKFNKLRTMEKGPADAEKKIIAQKCLEQAMSVMDERKHQEYVRKAWRLEHDRASLEDVDEEEFRSWVDKSIAAIAARKADGANARTAD
eukprot:TRINITY_DN54622_c0_g1_i1.p1 TRINITY_DN54622_c0_g1~~TRINITY_DN54622_c0_g1_i1.p1  ORF type:complete len:897 (+),score=187.39 TRINITY_DN54622_c0_g1_i1:128-2692(+)